MLPFYSVIQDALAGRKPRGAPVSQGVLAVRLGCSQTAVSNYAIGRSLPAMTRIPDFAEVLGMTQAQLATIIATDRAVAPERLARGAAEYARQHVGLLCGRRPAVRL